MTKRFIWWLCVVVNIWNVAFAQNADNPRQSYTLPLKLVPALSGNFGELRPNHFHAGLDFKTQGSIGHPIYAFDDGWVARAAVNAYGYGLVLYVAHPSSGLTTVYAHLNAFSDSIAKEVLRYQIEHKINNADIMFKPDQIKVKRGQQIAKSGNTGSSGGPHLHFEIRDTQSGEYYDPMDYFKKEIKDSIAPRIRNIYLYPLGGVAGGKTRMQTAQVVTLKEGGRGINKRLTAWGKIGIGLKAYDHMSGQNNIYGVKYVKLYQGDTLLYSFRQHSFKHEEHRFTNSLTDFKQWNENKSMIMKSFREPGNYLRMIDEALNDGVVEINEERPYHFRYELQDAHGNRSTLHFTIHGKQQELPEPQVQEGVTATHDAPLFIDSLGCRFELPAYNLYTDRTLAFGIGEYHRPMRKTKEGKRIPLSTRIPCSPVYGIGDEYIPLHGYGELRIALPDSLPVAPEKIYIACLNKKEAALKSVLLHAEENSATSACMQTSIRTLGKYALCIDTIAPKVTVSGTPSYRRIAFNIGDTDSDIRSWQGDIDGVWVPFDMNAQGQVVARPETLARMGLLYRDGLEKGKNHIVTLTATDACGNITTCTTQVWF